MASIKQRIQSLSILRDAFHLRKLWEAALVDMTELRTELAALLVDVTAIRTSYVNARTALANMCLTDPDIAIGTTPAKIKTTNSVEYLISGVWYTKGATDDLWTLTGFDCTNDNYNKCLLCLDASGDPQIVAGTEASAAASVTLGAIPSAYSVLGMVLVNPTGTGDFTGGTTALNDGTVVPNAVYTDLAFHPDTFAAPGALTASTPDALTLIA